MKKNLIKSISIVFLVFVLLTWFINTGYYSDGSFIKGDIVPIGLFDIIRYPIISFTSSVFILTALVILLIGGFYGVLNKTGAYQNLINKIVIKFKNKEKIFLIITSLMFVILSSLTSLNIPLLIMVPLFSSILMLLGFDKITTMLSTIGSILIGNIAATYGFYITGYITYFTNDINNFILFRFILLFLVSTLLVLKLIKSPRSNNIPLNENKKSNKKIKGLVITYIIMMLILFVGMINWEELFGITIFNDFHEKIFNIKINGYPVFSTVIGSIYELGKWTNYEVSFILLISTFIIGKIYDLSFKEIFESFFEGIKKIFPVALMSICANILLLVMNVTTTNSTIFPTIANYFFELTDKFNILSFSFVSFVGSILYNDFPFLLNSLYDPIVNLYSSNNSLIGILIQMIYGLVQFIAPTSVLLVVGLTYFEIDYKEWFKNIYKFLLGLIIIIILISIICLI